MVSRRNHHPSSPTRDVRPKKTSSAEKPVKKDDDKKKKKRQSMEYSTFIRRLFKKLATDISLSKKAMSIFNSFAKDLLERLAIESGRLSQYGQSNKNTLTYNDVRTAVKLIIKGELGTHACSEGMRALQKHKKEFGK